MSDSVHASAPARDLRHLLASVRRGVVRAWVVTALCGPAGVALLTLLAAVVVDRMLVLPASMRMVLLGAVIVLPLLVLRRAVRRRPETSDEELALQVEHRHPGLNNLLINSLQLGRDGAAHDAGLVEALQREAGRMATAIRPAGAVDRRGLRIALGACAAGGLIVLAMFVFDADALGTGLNRVLLPYADNTLTRIADVTPGDVDVLNHEALEVSATIEGRVPTQATLRCVDDDGRRTSMTMSAASSEVPDRLVVTLDRVDAGGRYRIEAGDDRSEWFAIRVHERPSVKRVTATIEPPDYMKSQVGSKGSSQKSAMVRQVDRTVSAVVGSKVRLEIEAADAERVADGRLVKRDGSVAPLTFADGAARFAFTVEQAEHFMIELRSAAGFDGAPYRYDVLPTADRVPVVEFVEPAQDPIVAIDSILTLVIRAADDFAVRELQLAVVDPSGDDVAVPRIVQRWASTRADAQVNHQVAIRVAELGLSEDRAVALQALAFDFRPEAPAGRSRVLTLRLGGDSADGASDAALIALDELIALQRTNIEQTRRAIDEGAPAALLEAITARQEQLRRRALEMSRPLADDEPAEPTVTQRHLGQLADTLMVLAIEQLRTASSARRPSASLGAALQTERSILLALTLAAARQEDALNDQPHRRIAQILDELIARQKTLAEETGARSGSADALSTRQRMLGRTVAGLRRRLSRASERGAGGDDGMAARYGAMAQALDERRVRAGMLVAADELTRSSFDGASARQQKVIEDLLHVRSLLRDAQLASSKKQVEQTADQMSATVEKLERMEQVQKAITEVAEQLRQNADLTEGRQTVPEDLDELEDARQNMAEAVEQLIEDMHLLPEMSASNDLLEEMAEIYEDIVQAEGSESEPISEIAVDRDEGLLATIREMQKQMTERMADMEMWLMDKPDQTRWKQESFDRDELGKIPLGDLPDALEDIVGDLLEQSEQLSAEAEDSASNAAIPDAPMGWDIADGPMPSWSAKGKSGNDKPNANEQVGRSGSGRQGKSSGEIVGDTVKALKGAEVEARRTQDGFQSGALREEDPGAMDVKATGGGKMAGTSDTQGMTGNAPPRDELAYRRLQGRHDQLKEDVETVYSKARLLRLPTGTLDRALLELDVASRRLEAGDLSGFARGQQQVARALAQTRSRLAGKAPLIGAASGDADDAKVQGATAEPVPEEYEQAVARYLKRIAE